MVRTCRKDVARLSRERGGVNQNTDIAALNLREPLESIRRKLRPAHHLETVQPRAQMNSVLLWRETHPPLPSRQARTQACTDDLEIRRRTGERRACAIRDRVSPGTS